MGIGCLFPSINYYRESLDCSLLKRRFILKRKKRFTHIVNLRLPVELKEQIRAFARIRGVSMAQIVREAIDEELRRRELRNAKEY